MKNLTLSCLLSCLLASLGCAGHSKKTETPTRTLKAPYSNVPLALGDSKLQIEPPGTIILNEQNPQVEIGESISSFTLIAIPAETKTMTLVNSAQESKNKSLVFVPRVFIKTSLGAQELAPTHKESKSSDHSCLTISYQYDVSRYSSKEALTLIASSTSTENKSFGFLNRKNQNFKGLTPKPICGAKEVFISPFGKINIKLNN